MKSKQLVSLMLIVGALLTAQPTLAKGGTTSVGGFPAPTTIAGPCDFTSSTIENPTATANGFQWDTVLVHPNYPGGAIARVNYIPSTRTLYLSQVCLDEGWTISKYATSGTWSSDGGFVLTVAFNGVDATRIKEVLGGYRMDQF